MQTVSKDSLKKQKKTFQTSVCEGRMSSLAEPSPENDDRRPRKSRYANLPSGSEFTRRALAPFLSKHRRRTKLRLTDIKEEFRNVYQEIKPAEVLARLAQYFEDNVDLPMILNETSEIIKNFTKSDGVSLYLIDPSNEYIILHQKYIPKSDRHIVRYPIEPGSTVAAYVAYVQEFVVSDDILGDPRFPQGIPGLGKTVKSVLCLPVLTCTGDEVLAVIELYKTIFNEPYSLNEQQMAVTVTGWMGAALHQHNDMLFLKKENDLIRYLLNLLQLFFSTVIPFDKFVSDIVIFARTTVGAERGTFYHMTTPVVIGTEEDIFIEAYEECIDSSQHCYKKKTVQRNVKASPGVAGHVARSGQSIMIKDAYKDPRFSREADTFNFRSRSVLAVPVKSSLHVLGVLKLVNKLPYFTEKDEQVLQVFSSFLLLATQFEKASTSLRKTLCRYKGDKELLCFHMKPCPDDMEALVSSPVLNTSEMPRGYFRFDWFPGEHDKYYLHYVIYSMNKCLGSDYFDHSSLTEFVLMVKKSYRPNPYHNFLHAFTVFHCVFNIIIRNTEKFTTLEKAALLIATLCHDADHFGRTNSFLGMTDSWLADLYEESSLEHHHFDMCLLFVEVSNLFSKLTPAEYQEIQSLIEHLILSTDLARHFKTRGFIAKTMRTGAFDWSDREHRSGFMSVIMTCCDISGQCKPFPIAKYITECLYREFHTQGDEEKKFGVTPLALMDRNQIDLIPVDQIQFLTIICIPCLEVLVSALPNTDTLLKLCQKVRDSWITIKHQQDALLWWPEESLNLWPKSAPDPPQGRRIPQDPVKQKLKIKRQHSLLFSD